VRGYAAFLLGLLFTVGLGAGLALYGKPEARQRVRGWVCGP
jgi:hypothetical protein